MALSASPAAFVAANAFVAGVLDNAVTSRLYTVNSYSGGDATHPPTAAVAGAPADIAGLPTVQSVTLVTASDGTNDIQVGQVRLVLAPEAGDVVDSSSPMQLTLSPGALVVVASTATG